MSKIAVFNGMPDLPVLTGNKFLDAALLTLGGYALYSILTSNNSNVPGGGLQVTDSYNLTNTTVYQAAQPQYMDGLPRNPNDYLTVLQQFSVQSNPRYTPRLSNTYCVTYAWDVTSAMNAEIPYIVDANGAPGTLPGGTEQNGNAMAVWLANYGSSYGWNQTDANGAVAAAYAGNPTVASWYNPSGPGHIAMVIPSNTPGVQIAQAGSSNLFDVPIANGFGTSRLPSVIYYTHA